jgi:hypothetical protein
VDLPTQLPDANAHPFSWTHAAVMFYQPCGCFFHPSQVDTCNEPSQEGNTLYFLQVPPTEQGLKKVSELVVTYPQIYMTWMGPIFPIINLCHPDIVRSVLSASGTHAGGGHHGTTRSKHPILLFNSGRNLNPSFLLLSQSSPSFLHVFISSLSTFSFHCYHPSPSSLDIPG